MLGLFLCFDILKTSLNFTAYKFTYVKYKNYNQQ